MTFATDIDGTNANRLSTVEVPHIESLEELDAHFEQTYGPDVLKALKDSNVDQSDVVRQLHAAGLNGRSEAVERTYRLHQQEFARKESLLGTTWRWTKEAASATASAVTWPFRKSWEFAYNHPGTTALIVAAAVAGGLYLAWGLPVPIPNPIEGAAEVAGEIAAPTGGAFDAIPQGQMVPPNFTDPYIPSTSGPLPEIAPPPPVSGFSPTGGL